MTRIALLALLVGSCLTLQPACGPQSVEDAKAYGLCVAEASARNCSAHVLALPDDPRAEAIAFGRCVAAESIGCIGAVLPAPSATIAAGASAGVYACVERVATECAAEADPGACLEARVPGCLR